MFEVYIILELHQVILYIRPNRYLYIILVAFRQKTPHTIVACLEVLVALAARCGKSVFCMKITTGFAKLT